MNANVTIDYATAEKIMDFDGRGGGVSKVYVKTLGDKTAMKMELLPGFSWAKSIGPKLPKNADGSCPAWCPATHFGYQTAGTCKVTFEDGTDMTINAGDSYLIDKPHLPEIVGDETVVMHEFSQQVKKLVDSMKD